MSGLFAGFFQALSGSPSSASSSPPRHGASGGSSSPAFNIASLQQLYDRLCSFRESDLEKGGGGDAVIETVRQITEAVLWGEQYEPLFFDFFCEKGILQDLIRVLSLPRAPKRVKLQLLQTLSMLIQNIRRQTSVYYLLSNNHVNKLMSAPLDFDDDEILAYYITLMKSLAMKLDVETIKFFFIQHPEQTFPLYIEATKFFSHRDHMVRATVRAITLQVYRIVDQPMQRYVLRHASEHYFNQLATHMKMLWLALDDAASALRAEGDTAAMSMAQRENELQQDLLIYLSDVFELGVEALNEVLANRLLHGVILPNLVASFAVRPGPTGRHSVSRSGLERTLSHNVALFLVRQIFDTFHCKVLLAPLAAALLQSPVSASLAYSLPWCSESTDLASIAASPGSQDLANPMRGCFFATMRSGEDRTFVLAAGVVHAVLQKRQALSLSWLEEAGLVPLKAPTSTGGHPLRSGWLRKSQTTPTATPHTEESFELLAVLIEALEERPSCFAWQLNASRAVVRMLLEVFTDETIWERSRGRALWATQAATRAAAQRVSEMLREAVLVQDGGSWFVDVFVDEWEHHKAPLPLLTEFFAEPRRLLPLGDASSRRSAREVNSGEAERAVRSLLLLRRLLMSLQRYAPTEQSLPAPPPSAREFSAQPNGAGNSGSPWAAPSQELTPFALEAEVSQNFIDGMTFDIGSMDRIVCGVASAQGKRTRYLILHSYWLLLVQPDLATPGWMVVTNASPIWQVQSLIDRSDPRTLQLGMRSQKPGCDVGAGPYHSHETKLTTLTLSFEDVKRCHDADVHLQRRRFDVRSQILKKASAFVDTCCSQEYHAPMI